MKHTKLILLIVLLLSLTCTLLNGCQGKTRNQDNGNTDSLTKHTIPYPPDYNTMASGASSYQGMDDHVPSDYFKILDVYNMKSNKTLTIISNFKTYQQTTEYTCGACSALMVLYHNGETSYDEQTIAKKSDTSEDTGVGVAGLTKFFKEIGWKVESSSSGKLTFDYNNDENAPLKFKDWVKKSLKANNPIMVDWLDWNGHWQTIIGYDTMGTEDNFGDDVIIMADPYDTSDHYQDGYYLVPGERFFYMWRESSSLTDKPDDQPWIIATP